MKKITRLILLGAMFIVASCSKDKGDSSTTLGGDTTIDLNAVDSVSYVYGEYEGENLGSSTIKVKANNDGVVTYEGVFDLSGLSPANKIKAATVLTQLKDFYELDPAVEITPDQKLKFNFDLKITSEGYLDYFVEGKPWVMVKYDDGVGTTYSIKTSKGETLTRTITEKTGVDEWPLGFFLIKTTKVEQEAPADDPVIDRVIYRVNHRFGLVYLEYILKDGTTLKLDIFAIFV
jgi:hypothetical protein